MTNNAQVYRPPSKRPIIIAFAAAVIVHLCAVALASRRGQPSAEVAPLPSIDITGIEEALPTTPDIEASPLPEPPADSLNAEFVEPKPTPSIKRNPGPIRTINMARSGNINLHALALNAPRPDYPYEARRRNITGSGIVALTVDEASGFVVNAEIEQSVGNPILDQSALSALRRWRFKIGTPSRVRVPITFTITGATF
jgi:TonB family protein